MNTARNGWVAHSSSLFGGCPANAVHFTYDAIGRRVRNDDGSYPLYYYYDLQGRAMTIAGPYGWNRGEVYVGSMHLATYVNGKTYFSHTNLVGTTRILTDEQGAVSDNCTYWPFGDSQSCTNGTPLTPISYAGYERDPETGLDHMWFRYYNSRLGRFMSADPLAGSIGDPQSLNRFAYVLNDPGNAIDPLGLFGCLGHPSDACPGAQDVRDPTAGSCIVNGFSTSCGTALRLLNSGVAAVCPANDCTGAGISWTIGADDHVYNWQAVGQPINCVPTSGGGTYCPAQYDWVDAGAYNTSPYMLRSNPDTFDAGAGRAFTNRFTKWPVVVGSAWIPVAPGFGVSIPLAYIPSSDTLCMGIGPGVGGKVPGGNVGPVFGDTQNAEAILSGWSVSVVGQLHPAIGLQSVHNSSGFLGGPAAGSPGLSLSVTYSWCKQL